MRLPPLALIALLLPAVPLKAGDSDEVVWDRLVRRSKGVNVAKLQTAGLARYVFFTAGSRVQPISTLSFPGEGLVAFSSLDEAARFARARPQCVLFMDSGCSEGVFDDVGSLVPLNPVERSAFGMPKLDLSQARREAEAKAQAEAEAKAALLKRVTPKLPE